MSADRTAWVELAPEERAHVGEGHPYDFGYTAGMSRLIMAHERIGKMFRRLIKEVMFEPGELDRREREMVAAVAAAAQDCFY